MKSDKQVAWEVVGGVGGGLAFGTWIFGTKLHDMGSPWPDALREGMWFAVLVITVALSLLALVAWLSMKTKKNDQKEG